MRWIFNFFLYKNKQTKSSTINFYKLFFFFFKYHNFFKFNSFNKFMFNPQIMLLTDILTKALILKKKFLIIDDLTLASFTVVYNFFFFRDFFFFYKHLYFIYSRNKSKLFFTAYLKHFIFLKNIQFIIFLNENFFNKHNLLFNNLKIAKIGFLIKERKHLFLDYSIFIANSFFINNFFLFFLYTILKTLTFQLIKINQSFFTSRFFFLLK